MIMNTGHCYSITWLVLSFTMKVKLIVITMELSHGSGAVVASCCRGACFPSDRLLPLPPAATPLPLPHPRALSHLDGYERGYFKHVLYTMLSSSLSLSTSHCHHHHVSPPLLSACFPLSSPYFSVLCDLLKLGRHVITLLDTKNSRQPVFLEEEEEEEKGRRKTI